MITGNRGRYPSSVMSQPNTPLRQTSAHVLQPPQAPPNATPILNQQQQQQPPPPQQQMVSGSGMINQNPVAQLQPNVGMNVMPTPQANQQRQALQQLLNTLRSPRSPQRQDQILQILRNLPQLMAAFIKQRHQQQIVQQQQRHAAHSRSRSVHQLRFHGW